MSQALNFWLSEIGSILKRRKIVKVKRYKYHKIQEILIVLSKWLQMALFELVCLLAGYKWIPTSKAKRFQERGGNRSFP